MLRLYQRILAGLWICLQLVVANAHAQYRVLDISTSAAQPISLTPYFSVLEDTSRQLTLQEVQTPQVAARFKGGMVPAEALSFGYTNSVYWLKLELRNSSNQPVERMLEVSNARLTRIVLHQPAGNGTYQSTETGMAFPFDTRPQQNRYFVFPLHLPAQSQQLVYLQVNNSVPLIVPAKLWEPAAFAEYERRDYISQSLYFGMILAMVLFNLLLFLALRDSIFVYYVLFVIANAMSVACMNGLAKEWLWPHARYWAEISTYIVYLFSSVIGILFARRILNLPELLPRFDRVMLGLIVIYALLAIGLYFSVANLTKPAALLIGASVLVTFIAAIYGVYRRQRSAYFFLPAFVVYLVGVLAIVLRGLGLVPTNFFTINGMQIGSALEVVLLAFALADRFNEIRNQSAQSQAQAIRAENEALLAQARADQAQAQADAQQAHNETLQVQAELAQEQLVQSEKMASLGQLVASVTHEINTPIGAIKSSGSTITESLHDAFTQLPPLLRSLDDASAQLLMQLMDHANVPKPPMSSREERAIVKKATEQLESAGLEQARQKAVVLVNLNAHNHMATYIPLLQHAECERILQVVNDVATALSSAKNVNVAVDRVAKIVLALKSFSHFNQTQEKAAASLVEGVETVLTIYQGQTRVGVEVVRNYEDIPPLVCLADELNQVWTNLIHNALQAMNHQGTLTIGIRQEGDSAVVSVGDSGCGIPEELRSKIFDVFFTTKPAGVGSGLGLDIVKKIIQKHHGRIDLQSEVGVGTTFSVYLPYGS